jgi:hypothetical protein
MSTSFTRTREQIAALVLGKLGILGAGATPDNADLTLVYEALDLRLKEIHRLGIFWRKVATVSTSFTITANVATAASGVADLLFPISMTVLNGTSDVTPVGIIDIVTYNNIAQKTASGTPTMCVRSGTDFIFWRVPTANTTAYLTYEKIADDSVAATAPDIEVSMMRWMKDILCYDLADQYQKPESTVMRWMKECEIAERKIRALAVQRVNYGPVPVDNFRSPIPSGIYPDYRSFP